MNELLVAFALVAVVLTVSALASPFVERGPISFPIIFLGLGFALGARGLNLIDIDAHSPNLEMVATLTLALVLFLDAVQIQIDQLGRHWLAPALILGPGTLLIVALTAGASMGILGLALVPALIVGAALASTDPVVLRDVVRNERLPGAIRQVLKLEAGLNDLVVLPIILILIAVATAQASSAGDWLALVARLLLLGPAIGFAVGGIGSWLVSRVDGALGIRREFQALYGVGLVLAAYVAATAAGGDGFLAAFAAGLAVPLLNHQLCDCFLEYGEVTAEMAMLLAFTLFGAALSTVLDQAEIWPSVLLAVLAIAVIRPAVLGVVLARVRLSGFARAFVGWCGPRGLNSLLLVLLVVQAGVAGAESLLAIVGVVVLLSAVVHGASATPLSAWYGRRVARETPVEERAPTAAGLFEANRDAAPRISVAELRQRLRGADPPVVLDVRTRATRMLGRDAIAGSVRVPPDRLDAWSHDHALDRLIVAYCY